MAAPSARVIFFVTIPPPPMVGLPPDAEPPGNVAESGSLSPDSFRARRMPATEAVGQQETHAL